MKCRIAIQAQYDICCHSICRYSYMIDNIILLITGTLHQRPLSELIPKCHPLGSFEQMEAIHIASTPAELYNAVLVDTPLGRYHMYTIWIPFYVKKKKNPSGSLVTFYSSVTVYHCVCG